MKRTAELVVGAVALIFLLAVFRTRDALPRRSTDPLPAPTATVEPVEGIRTFADNLEIPWALAFAPDGALFVTERPGRVVRLKDGQESVKILDVPGVAHVGEGGLLGLALDPRFPENQFLYLYYTVQVKPVSARAAARLKNRVVRYRVTGLGLADPTVLLDDIPGSRFHNGGRLAFGPDGNLYVTTGDAQRPELAQDRQSLAGKILRIRPDGSIPEDNPFAGSPVFSLGHRNPQGLAWHNDGTLYATEHGPSDPPPNCCHDEVNRIAAGGNYGWPHFAGTASRGLRSETRRPAGLVDPLVESGPTETWAPGGAAVVSGILYFGGLRGQALFALDLRNPQDVKKLFADEFGRIRDVIRGPDGALYLTTSNRDGRGEPRPGDDRVLRVDPASFHF